MGLTEKIPVPMLGTQPAGRRDERGADPVRECQQLLEHLAARGVKPYRVGVLVLVPREMNQPYQTAVEASFRGLGYVEGKSISFEYRSAGGQPERLPQLAAELVQLPVDVIVAGTNQDIAAAKAATSTIPIIMALGVDPVGAGFVESLARPGGNITGVTVDAAPETIIGKQLSLLKEAAPSTSRIAVLWNPLVPAYRTYFKAAQDSGGQLGLTIYSAEVQNPATLESAFQAIRGERSGGMLVFVDSLTFSHRQPICDVAMKQRLVTASYIREFAEAGCLISYGADLLELYRRAAFYVDRILKGARPGELPVELPTKFRLVLNLKAAKALGLMIPPSLLQRADQVIE